MLEFCPDPSLVIITRSDQETRDIGSALGKLLRAGDVVALIGDLGTGKTRVAQGVGRALGVEEDMSSPTFAFINEYDSDIPLMHADLYRLESEGQAEDLGLDEYFYGGWVCVVEWADRAPGFLPEDRLLLFLDRIDENERRLSFFPSGERYRRICEVLGDHADPGY
jgi:tRNA threonylcarbamoyladenosine biosynthesis protein TsaE